ncbi:MAG: CRISPR-associated protein Cas4 [Dehalococcoidia bacterium]|nr:CRISPR-associated protein Cas4 [Dehalococcoidia bacterium]
MFTEDDLLPISALQHLAFCERQWGLIHLEGVWEEDRLTAEGRVMHERADEPETEVRGNTRIARGLRLRSLRLGLTGKADAVEFLRLSQAEEGATLAPARPETVRLEGVAGLWRPLIVEYKRGRPKLDRCDEVQLCAQALCLEEMLRVHMPSGCFFYGEPRRRYDVALDDALRDETARLTARLHELSRAGRTPIGEYSRKCRSCSLIERCLPKVTNGRREVERYLAKAMEEGG